MKNRTTILPKKNRWGWTLLSIALVLLCAPVFSFTILLPHLTTAMPVMLVVLLVYVGPVSAGLSLLLLSLLSAFFFSPWQAGALGFIGCLLFNLPFVIASVYVAEKKKDFWLSSAITSGVMFASLCLVVGMIGAVSGRDAVSAITRALQDAVRSVDGLEDALIQALSQLGLLSAKIEQTLAGGMSEAQRSALVSEMLMLQDAVLRLQMPMQITTGSLAAGVFGQYAIRRAANRRGAALSLPALRTWRIPKGWGRVLGGTLLLLFLLSNLLPNETQGMFYVFSGLFELVFSLQGIAALCYLLHTRGRGRRWQAMVFLLGYFLFTVPALFVGLADQAIDFTHRRAQLGDGENSAPFDPRASKKND